MSQATAAETLLLRQPTVSHEHLAFIYAGDLWLAERDGRYPRRLTVHPGAASTPHFSPDGQWIAFSGNVDGGRSVNVISVHGGSATQLTFHPGDDWARGWTPDGERILFASGRDTHSVRYRRFFTVGRAGGFPEALPLSMGEQGAYSPDGRYLAYTRFVDPTGSWKRYRGGRTSAVWILDLDSYEYEEIPHVNASDSFPCWVGDAVYFLSDRHGVVNIFRYDREDGALRQITDHEEYDIKSLTAGPDYLAYEQAGRLHLLDTRTEATTTLSLRINPDLPGTRRRYEPATRFISHIGLSPSGARALFAARGQIFSLPAKKGTARRLAGEAGVHCRYPVWSPDGQRIAYLSDDGGEYQLRLIDQKGAMAAETISLGDPTFYYAPQWSPDGQKLLYTDKRLNLFYLNLADRETTLIDSDTYDHPYRSLDPVWSPDSRWIAYTKRLDTHIRAVFLYELASGTSHQVTDGLSDATSACFSPDGKYLYFAASTNFGLNTGWLDMSSLERPIRRNLYLIVLDQNEPSPLAPESDEEGGPTPTAAEEQQEDAPEENGEEPPSEPVAEGETGASPAEADGPATPAADGEPDKEDTADRPMVITLEGIDQRIVALPGRARNYSQLQAVPGKLLYLEPNYNRPGYTLHAFDHKERKSAVFLDLVHEYAVSHDGKKLLYRGGDHRYTIVDTVKKPSGKEKPLALEQMLVTIEPRAEWEQMFDEVARIQRDFFYDADLHGADWPATVAAYRPFLPHVGHRDDLNYLFAEMLGELVCGHAYVGGGDIPQPDRLQVGLLGADYDIDDGYYRFRRIFRGLNWHPELRAPLTEPGVVVAEGEYLLAVNGRPLRAPTNLYQHFAHTAERITMLTVGPEPDPTTARVITVVPIADESNLRHWSWVEENRRKVDELSGGRVAYVYMSDTGYSGYTGFNRYYFAQLDREGVVIDERFNGGGLVADYVIDLLDRPLLSYWATREGKMFTTPAASIFGPRVMIINEFAGSGGDAMPHFFRRRGLGTLVGKRTWGGLVGIYDYPPLIDGGFVAAPRVAIVSPDGQWEVENEGIPPDVEVEMTPKEVIAGRDPQLEKAVAIALAEIEASPRPVIRRPAPAQRAVRRRE